MIPGFGFVHQFKLLELVLWEFFFLPNPVVEVKHLQYNQYSAMS